jgi:V8-like Glu-specific endopeptidase
VAAAATLIALLQLTGALRIHAAAAASPGAGAGSTLQKLVQGHIFGADRRELDPSGLYPFSAIGKLLARGRGHAHECTSFLVGPSIALTNRHCVRGFEGLSFFFEAPPTGAKGGRRRVPVLSMVTPAEFNSSVDDWAMLRLKEPIGNELDWLDLGDASELPLAQGPVEVRMAGFSGDRGELLYQECRIHLRDADGGLIHDCSTANGASGSAIYVPGTDGRARVVAIHSASLVGREELEQARAAEPRRLAEFVPERGGHAVAAENFMAPVEDELWRLEESVAGYAGDIHRAR